MNVLRILVTLLAFSVALWAQSAETRKSINGIAAKVDGRVITQSEVREAITAQALLLQQEHRARKISTDQLKEEIAKLESESLDSLIERELILNEFDKLQGHIKPQYIDENVKTFIRERFDGDREKFLEELKASKISLRKFRKMREKMLIVQLMRQRETGKVPPPTPEQRDAYLKKHPERFRETDHIYLKMISIPKTSRIPGTTPEKQRKLAEEIRAKLAGGADFATEARTYSQDYRSEHGGDWGWKERDDFNPAMSNLAFSLKEKTLSDIFEDSAFYRILYIEKKREGKMKPMEEIQDTLEKLIMLEERKKLHDAWIARLKEKAVIKIMD